MAENDPTKLAAGVGIVVSVVWLLNSKASQDEAIGDKVMRFGGAVLVGALVGAALYFVMK